jgi:hypothetical protein
MKLQAWQLLLPVGLFLVCVIRSYLLRGPKPDRTLIEQPGATRLVVLVHGVSGARSIKPVVDLARRSFPDADLLLPTYFSSLLSNEDPLRVANAIERAINDACQSSHYNSIVLVGHSLGGVLLRKALVWAYGLEEDREKLGKQGPRDWVKKVDRFVSLASINRGWSLEPMPDNMKLWWYLTMSVANRLAWLTGTARLIRSMERGTPFVADLRVQWIRLARRPELTRGKPLPLTIHLLGDTDDVISREDSRDLAAAKDILFVTLPNTGHAEIASALEEDAPDLDSQRRLSLVRQALVGSRETILVDKGKPLEEHYDVRRIVYIMHGMRDYGTWGEQLEDEIERIAPLQQSGISVVAAKYRYFPMGPFLLYWDRQKNVRKFMDDYTENLARYPMADDFDYVGHSNGTYILASALQHYQTLKVGRAYFAGSVVPKHYRWLPLIDAGRVNKVVNVVATSDWVVALFPRFFEQVAEWLGRKQLTGFLDIGSAGFRGFDDGSDAKNRVMNLKFAKGTHSTGVEFDGRHEHKLEAVVGYVVSGDESNLRVFKYADGQASFLDFASNICWIVWLLLAALIAIGCYCSLRFGWVGFLCYWIALWLILNSV